MVFVQLALLVYLVLWEQGKYMGTLVLTVYAGTDSTCHCMSTGEEWEMVTWESPLLTWGDPDEGLAAGWGEGGVYTCAIPPPCASWNAVANLCIPGNLLQSTAWGPGEVSPMCF